MDTPQKIDGAKVVTEHIEKTKVKKAPKKRSQKPKTDPQEVKVVIEHQTTTALSTDVVERAIEPEKQGNKFMLSPSFISEKQVLKMLQRTPKEHIHTRPGKGGKDFDYVTGTYMKKVLNFVFGWNWDFIIVSKEIHGLSEGWGQIITHGRLIVKDGNGNTISKDQFGQAEVKYLKGSENKPVNLGNDFKSSATDALKKCAAEFGVASDVYGKNEFKEIKQDSGEKVVEKVYDAIKSMIAKSNNANGLKALNIAVTNAKISDEEKQQLYDLIEAKANGTTTT